jgi:VWFA-related protein
MARWLACLMALAAAPGGAGWQAGAQDPPPTPSAGQNGAEVITRDEPASFKIRANLVEVPVVVRDSKGRAVGSLTREDFQILDQGKPQVVASFSLQKRDGREIKVEDTPQTVRLPGEPAPAAAPERFIAYLFDDLHLSFSNLVRTRDAAGRHMAASLSASDRAAIFTTSGQTMLEYTDDRAKLREALARLQPRGSADRSKSICPYVPYYMADSVVNKNDARALASITQEVLACRLSTELEMAQELAISASRLAFTEGGRETQLALSVLRNVVRIASAMPGERSIVLVSDGFLCLLDHRQEVPEILDRAIHAKVVISTLDGRGVYNSESIVDASRQTIPIESARIKADYEREGAARQADVLGDLADGTGGTFVQGSNDYDGGFKRLAAQPEYVYVLGFAPQNLKPDGRFHAVKVKLRQPNKFSIQARRGYYAPKQLKDPAEQAKLEVEEALFSRDAIRDIPLELHTQYFKTGEFDAKLSVLARVDLRALRFRKLDGRNRNELTIVAGLFDRNGNFIGGRKKTVEMRLRDETLADKVRSRITVRTSFDVKPGGYAIRLVVRDTEGQLMAAENGFVEIP